MGNLSRNKGEQVKVPAYASSVSAANGVGYFLCACCGNCTDQPLDPGPPVLCQVCGAWCSCAGCHADFDLPSSPDGAA